MKSKNGGRLVPYDMVSAGFEAVYATDKELNSYGVSQGVKAGFIKVAKDDCGNWIKQWSVWPMTKGEQDWDERIQHINKMQEKLGSLDDEVRRLRIHIGSFVACDSGFPVTVDELLKAIGNGKLSEPAFHNGCWMGAGERGTQTRQVECMKVIHEILTSYLEGDDKAGLTEKYPFAKNFIGHTYEWLGTAEKLSKIQKLLMERMLLPFDFFTKASHCLAHSVWPENAEEASQAAMKNCFEEGGRGAEIDREIAELAGLPKISMNSPNGARKEKIDDPEKMELYVLCCCLAHGIHTLADCHHSAFRWIEKWIYGIGTGKWDIPTRKAGTERQRLGQLLFGYAVGLDKWLMGLPMQFVLLDLGHLDIGFDPKNEIIRVYAYLGEKKTPIKEWLAACLWHNLVCSRPAGLIWGDKYKNIIERAKGTGIRVNEWMELEMED